MALGNLQNEDDLQNFIRVVLDRLGIRQTNYRLPTYTTTTRPAASAKNAGMAIYVSDAAAGSKFQGSDGSSWVSLG